MKGTQGPDEWSPCRQTMCSLAAKMDDLTQNTRKTPRYAQKTQHSTCPLFIPIVTRCVQDAGDFDYQCVQPAPTARRRRRIEVESSTRTLKISEKEPPEQHPCRAWHELQCGSMLPCHIPAAGQSCTLWNPTPAVLASPARSRNTPPCPLRKFWCGDLTGPQPPPPQRLLPPCLTVCRTSKDAVSHTQLALLEAQPDSAS